MNNISSLQPGRRRRIKILETILLCSTCSHFRSQVELVTATRTDEARVVLSSEFSSKSKPAVKLGMGSALETLCGQAFGAGQVHMLGLYMQRSILILFTTCILLLPLYIFATPVLQLLGQNDGIAYLVGTYTLLIVPQLFSLSVVFPTQKFLQAQSKVSVLALIAFCSLLLQVLLCWFFLNVLDLGRTGAALAFDITGWCTAIAQFVYVVGWCKDGWKGFSWNAFKEIGAFVRLSLASAVMLCLEIWYMMSIIVLTGHLDNAVNVVGSLSIW